LKGNSKENEKLKKSEKGKEREKVERSEIKRK
jgi:hypothetical protein